MQFWSNCDQYLKSYIHENVGSKFTPDIEFGVYNYVLARQFVKGAHQNSCNMIIDIDFSVEPAKIFE